MSTINLCFYRQVVLLFLIIVLRSTGGNYWEYHICIPVILILRGNGSRSTGGNYWEYHICIPVILILRGNGSRSNTGNPCENDGKVLIFIPKILFFKRFEIKNLLSGLNEIAPF